MSHPGCAFALYPIGYCDALPAEPCPDEPAPARRHKNWRIPWRGDRQPAAHPHSAMTIEATDLIGVRLSSDGKRLRLRLRDQTGQSVSVSLPACWLSAMLNAVPPLNRGEAVHPLESWSMDHVGIGEDLVLTLRTPEGQAISFLMKPWQVEGMATIATYGRTGGTPDGTVH